MGSYTIFFNANQIALAYLLGKVHPFMSVGESWCVDVEANTIKHFRHD
jgi:hypothetical protein